VYLNDWIFKEILMKHLSTLAVALSMAMLASAQAADLVQDQTRTQTQATQQVQNREQVYGSELMTPQERTEYQNRMRSMKTEQEREALRLEHHKQMQARAKAQGKTLPDMPPAGHGGGMGPGMGPSGGMGGGQGGGGR
jgi:opacity protein-like surface antigen